MDSNKLNEAQYFEHRETYAEQMQQSLEPMSPSMVAELYNAIMNIRQHLEIEQSRALGAFIVGGDPEIDDMFDDLLEAIGFYEKRIREELKSRAGTARTELVNGLKEYRHASRADRMARRNGQKDDPDHLPY